MRCFAPTPLRAFAPLAALALALAGCPTPTVPPDASVEVDAGEGPVDAGSPDAGRRDAGTPDAGFLAAPIAQWCALRALAECDRDVRCGRLSPAAIAGCVLVATSTARCDQVAFTRGVTEGRLRYVEADGVACLNAFAAGSCEDVPAACARAFTGTVPPDGGCVLSAECDPDAGFCDLYDDRCPHRCSPWRQLGETCDGFYARCDPATLGCDTDAGVSSCVPKKAEGDPCVRYDACGDDKYCTSNQCVLRRAGPQQACGRVNGFPYCTDEFFCRQGPPDSSGQRPPGTCERKAGLGGTCTGPGTCLPSLRCSTLITTGTCLAKAKRDEGCINYDDCEDDLYCDARRQKCTPLPGPDGGCAFETTGYRCAPGSTCAFAADDVCVAWKPDGADCGYSGECLSNVCDFVVRPDGGFGGTCTQSCSQLADAGP